MPQLSVVTIAWNNLEGLRETGRSLRGQTFMDFEWIIVDGASTDGTVEAAAADEFAGATFVAEPDKGLYDAMNKGIERATGDYIIFMNSGDAFADDAVLADVAQHGAFGTAPILYGDAYEVEGDKRIFKGAFHHRSAPYTMFTHHQAIFYRREQVGDLRYDLSYRIGADWVFTGEMLKREGSPEKMDRVICNFERGGLSQSAGDAFLREVNAERRRAMREVFDLNPLAIELLVGLRHLVNVVRSRLPGLYDRLRTQVSS